MSPDVTEYGQRVGSGPQWKTTDLIELRCFSCPYFLSTFHPPDSDPHDRSPGPGTQAAHTYDLHQHPSDLWQPRFFSAALFTRRAIKSNLIGPTQLDVIKSS